MLHLTSQTHTGTRLDTHKDSSIQIVSLFISLQHAAVMPVTHAQETCACCLVQETCMCDGQSCQECFSCTSFLHAIEHSSIPGQKLSDTSHAA